MGGGNVPAPVGVDQKPVVAAPETLPFNVTTVLLAHTEKSGPADTTGFGIMFTIMVRVSAAQPVEGTGIDVRLKTMLVRVRSLTLKL